MIVVQKREPWLDNTKMVAMLCVMAGHTAGLFANGLPGRALGIIVAFNMPLFVLLSGYTSFSGLQRLNGLVSLIDYAAKILWRMVVPAVCLSAIDQAWNGYLFSRRLWFVFASLAGVLWLIEKWKDGRLKQVPDRVLFAFRVLLVAFLMCSSLKLNMYWFLSMLMKLQLTAAVMVIIGKKMHASVSSLVTIISALLWSLSYFVFDSWTFEMSAYFALGLMMKQAGLFERLLQMNRWIAIALGIIGCVLCRWFTMDYGFYKNSLSELLGNGLYCVYPLRIVVALLISFAIIRWVYALSDSYSWFSKLGSCTLAFYTIHVLILDDFIKPYVYFDNPSNYMWVFGILATIALTAITYIIIRMCERWVATRRLVLGDWK